MRPQRLVPRHVWDAPRLLLPHLMINCPRCLSDHLQGTFHNSKGLKILSQHQAVSSLSITIIVSLQRLWI